MEPHPDPDPSLRERRILVLHNRDFEPEGEASDPGALARIDVLNAARDVGRALVSRGHFVEVQGIDQRDLGDLLAQLSEDAPDLVFNLCESLNGDAHSETVVPTLLDLLRVPYTGSGPLTLGLCVRKDLTKHLLRAHGVSTPPGVVLPSTPRPRALDIEAVAAIGYPVIVKLVAEDASVGITLTSVVDSDEALVRRVAALREEHRQPILVERYIDGRELYVAMLGDRPPRILPVQKLEYADWPAGVPRILSYDTKWDPKAPTYHRTSSQPARSLPPGVEERAIAMAQRCFEVLEVRDYGRCDLRVDSDGTPYIIDVNPNCDLADGAGFSRAATLAGLAYDQLIERIAFVALLRSVHDNSPIAVPPVAPPVHTPSRPPRRP
jgi:D-alanine-D-alanine ligase